MKKSIIILALFALVGTSCSEFLNTQPEGSPTNTTYFTNDQQAIDAVDALYERFHQEGWYGREMFWEQGAACDIVWAKTRGFNTLATFEYTGNESPLTSVFGRIYSTIARCNWVIQELSKKEERTEVEERSLGEAYFVRGWAHFIGAYRYGTDTQGVPFCRWEDFEGSYDNSIPEQRATVMENFQLVIDDMDSAMKHLPKFEEYDVTNRGRAHDAACVAFKAKAYAYWATWDATKWDNVITLVNSLESEYGRALAPKMADVFSSDFANYWNPEYIWSIPGTGGSTGGGSEFPGVILEDKGWGIFNGWGQIKPTENIYQEFLKDGENNERLLASILTYGQKFMFFGEEREYFSQSNLDVGFQINKYMDAFKYADPIAEGALVPNENWPVTRCNLPVIRFAEMLLFRAEAKLAKGDAAGAAADINKIRVRSGLTPIGGSATWTDLYHERRCELAFEFTDHLYDLKRWHRNGAAEIKALAAAELNEHPDVRYYVDRADPHSDYTVGEYADYLNKKPYQDYMMVFPYPNNEVTKSNGQLKQNPGYAGAN